MSLARRPRFVAGSIDLTLAYPTRAWTPVDATIGGSRTGASGVPASYIVRRDSKLLVTVRVHESEWAAFLDLIIYGQSAQVITWYPDAGDVTTFTVYLDAPGAGDTWNPTRDSQYPRVFEVALTLRDADGTPLWLPYFDT